MRKVDVLGGVTTNTDYIGGIQYDGAAPDALDFIQTEEGKAVKNGNTYEYQYYLGDNLGNTRVTFGTKNGIAQVDQQDDYYPFGLEILRTSPVPNPKNEYLYNKKELQEEFNEYDYGARFYDPVIARWTSVDPLAEVGRRWSPYNYVMNNPVRLIDPDGMFTTDSEGNELITDPTEIANFYAGLTKSNPDTPSDTGGADGGDSDGGDPPGTRQTAKADAAKTISKVRGGIKPSPAPKAPEQPTDQGTISAPQEPVNYQDLGLPTTSLAIGTNVVNGYSAIAGYYELKTAIWGVEGLQVATSGETSATRLGKAMHALYKAAEADGINTFKEYTGIKGIRPDFVDFGTRTIYELKPNNLRAAIQGVQQLNVYKAAFEKAYPGTIWKIVLDTY